MTAGRGPLKSPQVAAAAPDGPLAPAFEGTGTASRALPERLAGRFFQLCAALAALAAAAVVATLASETALFFTEVSPVRFFTDLTWTPVAEEPRFGILPLLAATAQITVGAAVVAFPLGLLTAVYLEYYSEPRTARILTAAVIVLAAVPTVVYGYVALNFVTPALKNIWPSIGAYNGLSACLVVGVMILPTVALLSRSALQAVSPSLTDAGLALGASPARILVRGILPAASGGIVAALALAIARAVGETMIVTLAAGNQARLTWSPLEGLRTLTAYIAQGSMGDAASGTTEYRAFFAVAAVLFAITYTVHALGRWLAGGRSRRAGAATGARHGGRGVPR